MEKFYYVHNRRTGNPTYRHRTVESALSEALRLTRKHKKNFYVLESVKHTVYNHDTGEIKIESTKEN